MIKKLVKCKACDKDISNKANNCPQCGHPVKSEKEKIKEISSGLAALIVIIIALWIWLSPSKDKEVEPEPALANTEQVDEVKKEQRLLDECESLVLPQVTDASTYSRSRTSSYVVKMHNDNYSIKLNFTAKDGVGEKIKFQGVCLYETQDKNLKLLRVVERNR